MHLLRFDPKSTMHIVVYEELLELLDQYEKMNKTFLDKHDLNAPNRDEDSWDEL